MNLEETEEIEVDLEEKEVALVKEDHSEEEQEDLVTEVDSEREAAEEIEVDSEKTEVALVREETREKEQIENI